MKIALVHDQLHEFGGAERVFLLLKKIFPQSDVFTAYFTKSQLDKYASDWKSWNIKASFAQKIPYISRLSSPLRFLDPWIWESFDFKDYDLVISSSGGHMCKGIITRPETTHISYVHHQPRYLYYYATAMNWQKYLPVKIYGHFINHFLRLWDFVGSQRPDVLIANSYETARRIKKLYRRDATVVYPPVDMPSESDRLEESQSRDYYVTISRLVGSKHIDLMIRMAKKMKVMLKIAGTGKDGQYLKSISNEYVEFLGYVPDDKLEDLYSRAKAFVNAAVDEEFGISPIEAMSFGVPVIAFSAGGLKETVIDSKNGYLYDQLSEDSLIKAIKKLEKLTKSEYEMMRKSAKEESKKYSEAVFQKNILSLVKKYARTT